MTKLKLCFYESGEGKMECVYAGCEKNEKHNTIVCVNGYGFYCEEHMEDMFVTCPHCETLTEIPLKTQASKCDWCHEDISTCFI